MAGSNKAPGFFGKLPGHGDFVTRRLPPQVRLCFDHWLQEGLVQSRIDLGEAWLATWLGSPLWRFAVGATVCGGQAWLGVMMPSHDRVGRCFPLVLMAPLDGTPRLHDCIAMHSGWFEQLEDLALSALGQEFSLEAFDASLVAAGGAPCSAVPDAPLAAQVRAAVAEERTLSVVALAPGAAPALADGTLAGRSAWWTTGSASVAPCLAVSGGMPAPEIFAAFLDGRWEAYR